MVAKLSRITEVKSGVSDFAMAPDGRSIAFTMTDPKNEEEEKNDKARNDFRWIDENLKMSRLYVIAIQKDANGKREPRKLTTDNYNVDAFDWSPDSSRIAFSHTKSVYRQRLAHSRSFCCRSSNCKNLGAGKFDIAAEGSPVLFA